MKLQRIWGVSEETTQIRKEDRRLFEGDELGTSSIIQWLSSSLFR
jgi:hypothetical protein